jgi:hypothetical protein
MSGVKTELEEIKEDLINPKVEEDLDIKETKSEGAEEEPVKKIEKEIKFDEEKDKEKKEESKPKKKKRKKIHTKIWEIMKAIFWFIVNFPIWESFLNIFGSDIVFYIYIGKVHFPLINPKLCMLFISEPIPSFWEFSFSSSSETLSTGRPNPNQI